MESFQNSTTNILGNLSDTHSSSVSISLFVALLCICIVIGHLLGESRWMNESIASLFIGLASGAIVLFISKGKSSHILVFNEELFFIYLLPPIIFNAGFQVKKKRFFLNFATIILFGAVGTFVSFIIISLGTKLFVGKYFIKSLTIGDCLALGTIFSATDSVCTLQVLNQEQTPLLYSLVFGEGVVNDATSIVLFNAVQAYDLSNINIETTLKILGSFIYLYLTSTVLGIIAGLLSAYIIKKLCFGRHSTDREIAIMILMAYLSYTLAELFSLSGILTVFFCGIVMSHYTWHNVTESSRITTKHTFATMSFISEVFIFLYVGMDAVDIDKWRLLNISSGTFVAICTIMLGLVLLGRAAFVFPISCLSNGFRRSPSNKISFRQQVIIWWAGLMRGAVSMALAYNQFAQSGETKLPDHALIITSTIVVVVISTTVFGLMTKPMIHLILHQKQTIDTEISSSLDLHRPLVENAVDPSISDTHSSRYTVRDLWHRVDDGFMRPMFGGRGFATLRPGSPVEGGRS